MPFEKFSKSYFGSNYEKARINYESAVDREKSKFEREYPDADVNDFLFDADLNASGNVVRSFTRYVNEDGELFEITGYLFKKNYADTLYWKPRIWGTAGTIQPFVKNSSGLNVNSFKIYVTNDSFFDSNLPKLEIKNNENSNDYKDNPYLAALFAAYIATYSCGISTEHFVYNKKTPKIITSIASYHLYFHMKRFIMQPNKMSKYITREIETAVLNNKPVVYKWTREFHSGREQLGYWISKQPRGTIRDARVVMSKNNTGQLGISYMKRGSQTIGSLEDYKLFVASKSNGLTKTGQLLFRQSVESFVYCVLGAQANTRWPIVGKGAMSLQTQEVFKKLVNDTIIQSDPTVTISNMRKAIKDTNVVLNMVISPGIILIPSNLIILDKMEAGYNNVLKLATSGMKFGKNDDVNYFKPSEESESASSIPSSVSSEPRSVSEIPKRVSSEPKSVSKKLKSVSSEPKTNESQLILLITTIASGVLISKFVI